METLTRPPTPPPTGTCSEPVPPASHSTKERAPLSKDLQDLKLCYDLLAVSLVFLTKKKVSLKVSTVLALMRSFGKGKLGEPEQILTQIRSIIAIAPELFELLYAPYEVPILPKASSSSKEQEQKRTEQDSRLEYTVGEIYYCLEIRFSKWKGTGKGHKAKRDKLFSKQLNLIQASSKTTKVNPVPLPVQHGKAGHSHAINKSDPLEANPENDPNEEDEFVDMAEVLGSHKKIVDLLQACPFYHDQIVHQETHPGRLPVYASLHRPLCQGLVEKLETLGVDKLYKHQVKGIDFLREIREASVPRAVVIATSTSSGKSMVYNLPVVESVVEAKGSGDASASPRALYMFPTKALAQDQLRSLKGLCEGLPVEACTYDGDTARHDRANVINGADIIITNPDMLHVSILPDHKRWKQFFQRLEYIVLDEAHTYFGAFGSHVGCVLRRLLRICKIYREDAGLRNHGLKFVCSSATIGNPLQLFNSLVPGVEASDVCLIDEKEDGSPSGKRTILLWNPPRVVRSQQVDETKKKNTAKTAAETKTKADAEKGEEELRRKSSIFETAVLLAALIRLGVKTLAFARTRKLTELVLKYTLEELAKGYTGHCYERKVRKSIHGFSETLMTSAQPGLKKRVAGYRGGYTKGERREIEQALFSGKLTGVVATCALELGIDVGNLDAVLVLGFPGSISSMWQQFGRAGRSGRPSLSIVVCFDGPLDQHWIRFPQELLNPSKFESAILNPSNSHVLNGHLLCAGSELPLKDCTSHGCSCGDDKWTDTSLFGAKTQAGSGLKANVLPLVQNNTMRDRGVVQFSSECSKRVYETHSKLKQPFKNVSLRTIDPVSFKLVDDGVDPGPTKEDNIMDTIPYSRAFFEVYPGAVYMHQSKTFLISRLDMDNYVAHAHRTQVQYYTSPRDHAEIHVLGRFESKPLYSGRSVAHFGPIKVVRTIYGYSKIWFRSGKVFEKREFTLPALEFETVALWIDVPTSLRERMDQAGLDWRGGLHGANHVLTRLSSCLVICHDTSVATEHIREKSDKPQPLRLLVYDATPGGTGVTSEAFEKLDLLLEKARVVLDCECESGCTACVLDLVCKEYNRVLDKKATRMIFNELVKKLPNKRPLQLATAVLDNAMTNAPVVPSTPERKRSKAMSQAKEMGRAKTEQMKIAKPWLPHIS